MTAARSAGAKRFPFSSYPLPSLSAHARLYLANLVEPVLTILPSFSILARGHCGKQMIVPPQFPRFPSEGNAGEGGARYSRRGDAHGITSSAGRFGLDWPEKNGYMQCTLK